MQRNLLMIARGLQLSWDEALDSWDEFARWWDYRSAFRLICPVVYAIVRGNCGSKSIACRLAV
jgi:hypothetical protein